MSQANEVKDFLNRTNVVEFYGDQYPARIATAKNLLKKCPPQKFLDKWPKLADDDFRNNLSDNDAVVTMVIAIATAADKEISLYWCDDWNLLYENMILKDMI